MSWGLTINLSVFDQTGKHRATSFTKEPDVHWSCKDTQGLPKGENRLHLDATWKVAGIDHKGGNVDARQRAR